MKAGGGGGAPVKKKIMVVADPTRESTAALEYAISHVVKEQDELILLHVENPYSWRQAISMFWRRPTTYQIISASTAMSIASDGNMEDAVDFVEEMKLACKIAYPKLKVYTKRMEIIEGKDKANTILAQSKVMGVDVLLIGQRWSLSHALLGFRRYGGSMKGIKVDTAEQLIENSNCVCVGIQKKGQREGYLLNTKTHRNFWLLA